jgi:precorrin-3B synthase
MTRGWCPGVHEPMPSGDGMLVRVKPPGGRLPAAALRAIAESAERHGNGVIELTSRGNLQIRGLTAVSAPHFAAAMVQAGLADPDPARESRRNVITLPPGNDALATAIEATLADIRGLAPKFCVAIGPAEADLVVLGDRIWAEGQSYACSLDTLRRLAEQAAGRRLRPTPLPRSVIPGLLLALPFGQTDSACLGRLAALTDDARTTPWRALHIPTADPAPYEDAGFMTDPADPRRSIAACPGAPACASGQAPARADAARLAARGIGNIHVSGCAKGCAQPRAGLTLVGRAGRYDLIPHGRAADSPSMTGLTLEQTLNHLAPS